MPLAFHAASVTPGARRMAPPEPCLPAPKASDEKSGEARQNAHVSLLGTLDPGELFARGMQTVNFTGGAEGWVPPAVEELSGALPEFKITAFIGCGGMGAVYRGTQRGLEREVAVKLLRPELTGEESTVARFMNEARITAQLDHPNIPPVYVLQSDDVRGLNVFAMKLLEGQTLEEMLEDNDRHRRDGLSAAIEVLLRICDALAFAHARGVLHLDLKPANVVVGTFGQIYLVDWGVAQRKDDIARHPAGAAALEGTPAYMAPEQAAGERSKFDERTDTFALGGILYRILCGRAPHDAATSDEALSLAANATVVSPDAVAAESGRTLPRRLAAICTKALATEPSQRYQRVVDFQKDLEQFARGPSQLPQRAFAAGDAILTEGEPGDEAFVIISGECVATRQVHGQSQELRRMRAGEMFGEAAVFTGQPRAATVSAVTDAVVGVVEKAMLMEEMERGTFMSLAIRTVTHTFLDLDRKLTRQRQRSRVVELALRHAAVHSENGRMPWRPLVTMLAERTGESAEDVASWLLDAPGLGIEDEWLVIREE